jgi:spermidine synthase
MKSRTTFLLVLLCFFLSGAAGLIYQVAWTKALGLVFGHTVYAIATVLATFMAGLAAGGAFLGRWGGRQKRPVVVYGWIELLIAVTALFSLVGLSSVRTLYVATYHHVSGSIPILVVLRVVSSAIVLFIPTFLMGGTLPILIKGVTRSSAELGVRLSRLYWVNTAGAVVGALAGGFLLLPALGLHWTVVVAAAFNIVAGALALLSAPGSEADAMTEDQGAAAVIERTPKFLLVTFAVVGATAMIYEIAWSRLLSTTLGSSTYAFTIMLVTFLGGIVIGSFLFERWVSRSHEASLATYAVTQTLTGLGGVVFIIIAQWLPAFPLALIRATHMTFTGLLLAQFVTCAISMLPAAIIFGFNFPVVTLLISGKAPKGAAQSALVGRAYAANTVGAIFGALAAGFWLLPLLGSYRLVAMTVAANLLLAFFLHMKGTEKRPVELFGNGFLAVVVIVAGSMGLLYDPQIANFSAINHPEQFPPQLSLKELAHQADLLFVEDGLNASIEVVRNASQLSYKMNGKTDASTSDRPTQLMVGHLGAIFHPHPKKVLIIGFGSGMTVSAVSRYPDVEQIDCVEIEPAVLHAYPYLAPLNRGVLKDPRVHIIFDDARNFLFATRNRYDVIISEPSNPWIAGIATLFTREFYQQVKSRLQPGGLFVQWVQSYTIYPADMKMILGTVVPEFAHVSMWAGEPADFIVLAQPEAHPLTFDRLRSLWSNPGLLEDFKILGMSSPEGLLAYHRLDDADVRGLIRDAQVNTDDKTLLEYRAPKALLSVGAFDQNQQMIAQQRSHLLPSAVVIDDPWRALTAAAQTALAREDYVRAKMFLDGIPQDVSTAQLELLRGQWLRITGHFDEARQAYEKAHKLDPDSVGVLIELATVARLQKDYRTAETFLDQALQKQPDSLAALQGYTMLEMEQGNIAKALEWQIRRVRGDPSPQSRDLNVLGSLFVRAGDDRRAENIYAISVSEDPYDFGAHFRLGEIYMREGRWQDARTQLEFVIRRFPIERPEPYIDLAKVYSNLGKGSEARAIIEKGQRIFPADRSLLQASITN